MFNSNPRCRLCQQHIYNTYKCSIPIPDVDNAKNTYGQEKTEFHNFITGAAMTVELAAWIFCWQKCSRSGNSETGIDIAKSVNITDDVHLDITRENWNPKNWTDGASNQKINGV